MAGIMLEQGCSEEGKLKRKHEEQATLGKKKKKQKEEKTCDAVTIKSKG